jgi:3-methylfumaryl-CoA hydratase
MTDFSDFVGRQRVEEDRLDLFPARGMNALLDRDPGAFDDGAILPRGWHWLYFKPLTNRSDMSVDGHERKGAFLPDVGLPRRMWAGGNLTFSSELRLGEAVQRRSTIESIEEKSGRSGRLVFVNVRHRVESERGVAVDELQNLVYREAGAPSVGEGPAAPESPAWSEPATADNVTLFRFSALTFNAHRIHYDQPYSSREEGYPGVVVHGPLLALLLLDGATRNGGRPPLRFAYRAVSPLFAGEPFQLQGAGGLPRGAAGESEVWVVGPRGMAMRAMAGWEAD